MTSIIITKNSSTASGVPLAADLTAGELAINLTDKRLFSKLGSTVFEAGTNPSTLSLPNGTANGVPYLNGSKVLTSGSALTFDGTNLVNTSSSVGTPEIAIANSATSAGANARLRLKTGGSGATTWGDAFVQFTDSLNFNWSIGAGSSTSNALTFNQYFGLGTNELMRLTSTGLGIGTSSPSTKLQSAKDAALTSTWDAAQLWLTGATSTAYRLQIGYDTTNNYSVIQSVQGGVAFTNLLLNPLGGNVGIGTTSPGAKFNVAGSGATEARVQTDSSGNARLGLLASAYNFIETDRASGALTFTVQSGGSFPERARIDSSGNLLVGTTSATTLGVGAAPIQTNGTVFSGGANAGFAFKDRSADAFSLWYKTGGANYFYTSGAGTNVASINETTGAYTALSDAAKKKDFEESTLGLDAVMRLQPKLFRMLGDDATVPKQLGFIAQDVQAIIPQAYVEQNSGNSTFIGLQDRPFIAALVKAIQEQQALILSLQAQLTSVSEDVAALKAAA